MAIKYEKIQAGMTLWQKARVKMGNTTMSATVTYSVRIVELKPENRAALVSWNGNPPRIWYEDHLKKLYANKPEVKSFPR